jgi:protein-disulfide isomerase
MTRFVAQLRAVFALTLGGLFLLGFSNAALAQQAEVDTSTIVEMTQGADDAPVTIIEYASFTCPHCAKFHAGPLKQIKKEYVDTGKVKLIYRDVYFDRYGLWASMIARCDGPDKFFGIADLIYASQSTWSRAGDASSIVDELRKIGRVAGVDDAKLETCLQDGTKAQTLVTWYQANAEEHGIESTPSFIINGEAYSNRSYEDFKAIIDAELGN